MADTYAPLQPLIEQARAEGKWLCCSYQDLWFSPDQLEAANRDGRFRWGPINWTLHDPQERVRRAEGAVEQAVADLARVRREIGP